MKTTIELLGTAFIIKSKCIKYNVPFPYAESKTRHNKYLITVVCNDRKMNFSYYDSRANLGLSDLSESGLISAFNCLLLDTSVSDMSFEEFKREYEATRETYNACKKNADKFYSICDLDIYDLINEFNEKYEL